MGSLAAASLSWRVQVAALIRGLHTTAFASSQPLSELNFSTIRAESFYDSTVEKYASQDVEVLSLRQMLSFGRNAWDDPGKILKSARYVQRELPRRLARRLMDLQLLPYIVVANPHIKKVYNQYHVSFETLRRVPMVRTSEDNQEFSQLLRQHLDQHAPMLDSLATGLRECKDKVLVGPCLQMDAFFDSMLRSRISRRVIAEQHLHIGNKRPGYIGVICTDLDVQESISFAVQKTKQVCMETYGMAPDVVVSGESKVSIPYIPAHLDYMLYELLKNAMRAVVESRSSPPHNPRRHSSSTAPTTATATTAPSSSSSSSYWFPRLPPVHIRVCDGAAGALTIKISDQGGGIPDDLIDKVWSYGFTTLGRKRRHAAPPSGGSSSNGGGGSSSSAAADDGEHVVEGLGSVGPARIVSGGGLPAGLMSGQGSRYQMAGLGFGLPLSRLYARYFGGDLKLQSIPGYGTDAYLTLKHLQELDDGEWVEKVDDPSMLPIQVVPY
ncbi:pyruvate dehydrogenase kinase [Volvox carteri f. nagariensis]|uniref:Protein-serine/threonine kinase n=1 Tax=Volvox carteri f. nagariensis TaxID=3068 RepID=D8TV14_VOLCA|nr:pyruvate dehydrogenase kinase [Volvox carteri f. nagariensis]EFJ48498.1 pyruvate dehydrogenase kinase [Volvox carteri f. nagariensis]|eukprot:XP_002950297.1 pyruvate dehydrogenase kinase [Volvox carteri f. nagariensis]